MSIQSEAQARRPEAGARRRGQRSPRATALASSLLLMAAFGCGEEAPPPELPPRAIQWERVSSTKAAEMRIVSGIVTAVSDTELAFEVGGIVETVEVDLGDMVERDHVLARLDPEPFDLAVRDAEATLAEAEALRQSAHADFARTAELFEADVASRQEYDRALARRDSRDSQVEAARARLNLARRDRRRSVLRAPFAGAISVRDIDPANKVASGEVVFAMDSGESGLRVEVQMPETLIARVRQGDRVEVRFPSSARSRQPEAQPRTYTAVVSEVGTRARTGNAFPVRADLSESPAGLRPGMTAEVTFQLAPDDEDIFALEGFLLPIAAVHLDGGDRFSVFVFDPATSTVSQRPVEAGGLRDNEVAVLEGLAEGEIVATAGVSFLRDGQTVTLLGEELLPGVQRP